MSSQQHNASPIAAVPDHERQAVVDNPAVNGTSTGPENELDLEREEGRERKEYGLSKGPTEHSATYTAIHPGGEKSGHRVNLERAETEFAELCKELSHASHASQKLAKIQSWQSKGGATADVEKADECDSSIEPFDLESTLRGTKAEEEAAGIKAKRIGVYWDGLTVSGNGGLKNYVKTFPMAFVSFFNVYETAKNMMGWGQKGRQFDILKNFRGVTKPGEMVLVLGRPGSGCTTFLRAISNQRFGYTRINGDVLYGPFDSKTFAKMYRGEAVYNDEDDIHQPTLTVGQTLEFALETKVPGKRPRGLSRHDFKERVIKLLLQMFSIEHTRNTIVGNPFVQGISGGERKRVSIAEMMVTSATVCSWDNSTRGLDASTALDFMKSLRILTDIYRVSTFVSLYQASENIYQLFDKVMVINEGRQVFFGPAKEARAYFEGLGFLEKPRQTTPDYLTGCTDPFERDFANGRSSNDVPSTPDQLVAAFDKSKFSNQLSTEMSEYYQQMQREKEVYDDFRTAIKDSKRHTSEKSVYSIPFYLQVWALVKRQFLLKWQDKSSLVVSWVTAIITAIMVGTVWLDLPVTSAGAFTRGGVLYIALFFNASQAFSELISTMTGRPIVNKHRAYTFHHPSALWIAQLIVDLAFSTVQIMVFSIMVYFMCHLVREAGAFFIFYLMIVSCYLAISLFFRTVGCVCPDFDVAIRLVTMIVVLFMLTSGYFIQWQSEQVWLRWIFYINSIGLGFSALMINEFRHLDLHCTAESLIPSGPGYNDINHQVCTLSGSTAGSDYVSGTRYIETAFTYNPSDLWRYWGIIVVLIVAFLIANAFLGEYIKWGAGGRTVTYFVKENKERKALNEALRQKREHRRKTDDETGAGLKTASKAVLTCEAINYDVPVPSGQLRLLKDIHGYVKPGTLTALMGASGAGKTTLLDVLASRKNMGVITGDKLVDGKPPGLAFQRSTSYAEQLDVHEPAQTVREALRFSADLRQPFDIPQEEKYAYVEEVISLLEMEDIADAIIGEPESGLAVEQRKRVTIGVELAAKPELLLFLDEPTSGLDSQSAFNIVRFLRKLATTGQAILCTIHQPNSALFESFDRLLLLQRGGQCVYFGDIGKDAHVLLGYFRRHGADCPTNSNPAEWMLDAIGAGQTPRLGSRDWADVWNDSEEFEDTKCEIVRIKEQRLKEVSDAPPVQQKEYATTMLHQIRIVQRRTHLSFWRSPNYGFTRFFNHVIVALLTGLMFLQLDDSRASLQYRVFVIFQVTLLPAVILAQVEPKYQISRMIAYREQTAKAYKEFPFALAQVLAECPYSILCAVGFFLPLYYITGFQNATSRAGYQFFMILIIEFFTVTLGQVIAAVTPSPFFASLLNPTIFIVFALFCGVTVPRPQIPGFWRAWLYQLNPLTRLIGGMLVTELHELPVRCTEGELNRFTSPPGRTCGEYMADFFAAGGPGYIFDNSTGDCSYCAYSVGDQLFEPLGYSFSHRWRDLGILAAFIGSNMILLFIAASDFRHNLRDNLKLINH